MFVLYNRIVFLSTLFCTKLQQHPGQFRGILWIAVTVSRHFAVAIGAIVSTQPEVVIQRPPLAHALTILIGFGVAHGATDAGKVSHCAVLLLNVCYYYAVVWVCCQPEFRAKLHEFNLGCRYKVFCDFVF
ncbi:MAG: hypothetical protein N2235_05155 [Fischerella sp.]|nr:hypothetical protein [Fischerella sp.]